MQAPQYKETVFSHLYPGSQHSSPTFVPVLLALEQCLGLTPAQRSHTVLRMDAGFGCDANVDHALTAQWQVLTKGSGGRRPAALLGQVAVEDWQAASPTRWWAVVAPPSPYVRPVQYLLLRWLSEKGEFKYATLVCSVLIWSEPQVIEHYDQRGACETEIGADKGGLRLCRRRKRHLAAQETLVLLTDLAHNLLAWLAAWMFPSGPLAAFGPTRLIEDVLAIPGHLIFNEERLVAVELNARHPHAAEVAAGLERLLAHFDHP